MSLNTFKSILGLIAIALTFTAYVPYLRDIRAGKTKPHLYSWVLWAIVTFVVFGIQFAGGAGIGGFVTLTAALMCFVVIGLSLRYGVNKDVKPVDALFIFLALVALGFWLFAKQPIISAILSTIVDLLGFAPTVRKTWNHPYTETLSFSVINSFRFGLAVFALSQYSLVTALYPISWFLANSLFVAMLVIRRRQVPKESK